MYTAIQPHLTEENSRHYSIRIHWGFLDEANVFHSSAAYLYLAAEESKRFIFPSSWSVEPERLEGAWRHEPEDTAENKLYGDVWLLERIVEKIGLHPDLMMTFGDKGASQFVMFVGLTLSPYLKHVWKTPSLRKEFSSMSEILDEGVEIRCIQHSSHHPMMIAAAHVRRKAKISRIRFPHELSSVANSSSSFTVSGFSRQRSPFQIVPRENPKKYRPIRRF